LRAELSTWIERARSGEEVVVTDRGTPVARLLAVDTAPLLDQLIASGVLSKPRRDDRPAARGAARAHASGPVSELVSEQRRWLPIAIVYFDSSAFVKLVVEEDGSEVAATLWDGCDAAVSSRLAYPG
jgi:prevent-host-death family protein